MLRQYWFGLDLRCKGTDFLIKWSWEKHRGRAGEALLLLAGVDPSPLCFALPKLPANTQGSDLLGTTRGPGDTRGVVYFYSSGAQMSPAKLLEVPEADVLGGAAVLGKGERVGAAPWRRVSGHSHDPSTRRASASLSWIYCAPFWPG